MTPPLTAGQYRVAATGIFPEGSDFHAYQFSAGSFDEQPALQ